MTEHPEPAGLLVLSVAGVDGSVIAEILRFASRDFTLSYACGREWNGTRQAQHVRCRSFKQAVYQLSIVLNREYYDVEVWPARV